MGSSALFSGVVWCPENPVVTEECGVMEDVVLLSEGGGEETVLGGRPPPPTRRAQTPLIKVGDAEWSNQRSGGEAIIQ